MTISGQVYSKYLIQICIIALSLLFSGCKAIYFITHSGEVKVIEPVKPTPPSTMPELIDDLSSPDVLVRVSAAYALGGKGALAKEAVPALTENLLYDDLSEVRESAAWALGEIGPPAVTAVPTLIEALETEGNVHARQEMALALGKIGDDSAVPALARSLYDEDDGVSIFAALSIALLANQDFPDIDGSGYSFGSDGIPFIVKAAKEWWEKEGKYQDWPEP